MKQSKRQNILGIKQDMVKTFNRNKSGIPKTERIQVQRRMSNGDVYYITSKDNDRSYYFLYKMENDKAVKLGKAKSPLDLESKYIDKDN